MSTSNRENLEKYSAKIKHVLIQIKDFGFYHSPFSVDAPHGDKYDNRFIGRRKSRQRIINILRSSRTQSGTYLVAGFRGMGKTSLVRMAIAEYNDELGKPKQDETTHPIKRIIHIGMNVVDFLVKIFLLLALFCLLIAPIIPDLVRRSTTPLSTGLRDLLIDYRSIVDIHWIVHIILPLGICYLLFLLYSVIRSLAASLIYSSFLENVLWSRIPTNEGTKEEQKAKTNKTRYKLFEISLAEDRIHEDNILKRLTLSLLDYWKVLHQENRPQWQLRPLLFPVVAFNDLLNKQYNEASLASVEEDLRTLSLRISSRLSEGGNGVGGPQLSVGTATFLGRLALPFRFAGRSRTYSYDLATGKEVEEILIRILKDIDRLRQRKPSLRIPKFIFVIDELDKIEIPGILSPPNNSKEAQLSEYDPIYTPDSTLTRRRQQALAALLGNMKNFLNIARSKFIFIGGRELYEASLADIADRDSFYSSIFNQTIYVESFFKDKVASRGGITQITEAYLCRLLLGDSLRPNLADNKDEEGIYRLKEVYQHLRVVDGKVTIVPQPDKNNQPNSYEDRLKMYKVIFLLQNYIIYLTYRSNGTPKKLASLIESSLVPGQVLDETKNFSTDRQDHGLVVWQSEMDQHSEAQFLRFRFDFQYEINLTAEIYRPFLIVNSRYLKTLGDKVLFSSTFIFDHILKFHPYGFSWRHLEMIPEIILVNREPNLREYVSELLAFLLKNNIRESVSGLFQYRFYNKVQTELSYLSKISDLSSAAFNFTLDESLQIKKHYRNKLQILQEKYKGYKPSRKDNHFVHSIYFVQAILGDLHFYDQEYDEAMIYYTESIQTLRLPMKDPRRVTSHQFILWLRSKLKSALTLEKMRNYDSALFHYSSLSDALLKESDSKGDSLLLQRHTQDMQIIGLPLLGALSVIEKSRTDGITYPNIKNAELDMMKMLRFPRIAESAEIRTREHQQERDTDTLRKLACLGDFYNNIGGLLHYKNCQYHEMYTEFTKAIQPVIHHSKGRKLAFPKPALSVVGINQLSNPPYRGTKVEREFGRLVVDSKKKTFQPGLAAFTYYYRALHLLIAPHQSLINESIVESIAESKVDFSSIGVISCPIASATSYLLKEHEQLINSTRFYYLANVISRMGDAILGCIEQIADGSSTYVDELTKMGAKGKTEEKGDTLAKAIISKILGKEFTGFNDQKYDFFSLETVFLLYRLANAFYRKAGKERSTGFQLRKMLFVIKDSIIFHQSRIKCQHINGPPKKYKNLKPQDRDNIITTCERMCQEIFKNVSRSVDNAGRPQFLKYQAILQLMKIDLPEGRPLLYHNISISSDIKESIILTEQIRVLLFYRSKPALLLQKQYNYLTPYGSVSNRYVRMFELEYVAMRYEYHLRQKRYSLLTSHNNTGKEAVDVLIQRQSFCETKVNLLYEQYYDHQTHFMVKESIFCLSEIIKSIHIYGLNNFVSYSYLARIHKMLAFWCDLHEKCINHQSPQDLSEYRKYIKLNLGGFALAYLEPRYHFELSAQYYKKAVSYHTEGAIYQNIVHKFHVLEDDYNDNLRHFVTSIERYRYNTGFIKRELEDLKSHLTGSKLYIYKSYSPSGEY